MELALFSAVVVTTNSESQPRTRHFSLSLAAERPQCFGEFPGVQFAVTILVKAFEQFLDIFARGCRNTLDLGSAQFAVAVLVVLLNQLLRFLEKPILDFGLVRRGRSSIEALAFECLDQRLGIAGPHRGN